jgi:hypothetical protein
MTLSHTPAIGESWTATRYSIVADFGFDELVDRFERAVPRYPSDQFEAMVKRGAAWDEIVDFAEHYSDLGLLVYWSDSVTSIMTLAGNTAKCAFYFIGNFPVAERMYRHDPRVMNYAPLRMTITEDNNGVVHFTTDRPSSEFASFGDPRIAGVGHAVDGKVAQLIARLGLPVPEDLTGSTPA